MSSHVQYTVTPLADVQHAVRIETMVPPSPFYDESYPVILQATAPEALPLMQSFLSGLSLGTSWTSRESRATLHLKEGVLPDGCSDICISHAMNSRRTGHTEWYCILTGADELLELSVLNETLAHQIFDALLAGTLQVRFADPELVEP